MDKYEFKYYALNEKEIELVRARERLFIANPNAYPSSFHQSINLDSSTPLKIESSNSFVPDFNENKIIDYIQNDIFAIDVLAKNVLKTRYLLVSKNNIKMCCDSFSTYKLNPDVDIYMKNIDETLIFTLEDILEITK